MYNIYNVCKIYIIYIYNHIYQIIVYRYKLGFNWFSTLFQLGNKAGMRYQIQIQVFDEEYIYIYIYICKTEDIINFFTESCSIYANTAIALWYCNIYIYIYIYV